MSAIHLPAPVSTSSRTQRLALLVVASCALAVPACLRLPTPPPPGQVRVAVAVANVTNVTDIATPALPPAPLYPDGIPYRSTAEPLIPVWLISDPLHTAMVFPYDWLLESGFVPPAGLANAPYINLSWGDRVAYFQHELLGPWQIFRAFFTPTPSVMEIIPINGYVAENCQQQRVWRKLVPREYGPALAAFLNCMSRTGADSRPLVAGPSSWGEGYMLESPHSYYLPRICNVWTAQAMEACGCSVQPLFGLTANGLIRQAERPANGFEAVWLGDGTKVQPPNDTPIPDRP